LYQWSEIQGSQGRPQEEKADAEGVDRGKAAEKDAVDTKEKEI